MWAMISSSSGWSRGSPPLMVTMLVPRCARWSMRRFIVSKGMGLEKSSYSLQYLQDRLQRRMGMMCAITGWSVLANPLAIIINSRTRRLEARTRRRTPVDDFGILRSFNYNTLGNGEGKRFPLFGRFRALSGVRGQVGGASR